MAFHRYSDFQVNEVDSQGQIISVTNQIIPDDPEEIPGGWRGLFVTLYWRKFQRCCPGNLIHPNLFPNTICTLSSFTCLSVTSLPRILFQHLSIPEFFFLISNIISQPSFIIPVVVFSDMPEKVPDELDTVKLRELDRLLGKLKPKKEVEVEVKEEETEKEETNTKEEAKQENEEDEVEAEKEKEEEQEQEQEVEEEENASKEDDKKENTEKKVDGEKKIEEQEPEESKEKKKGSEVERKYSNLCETSQNNQYEVTNRRG